MSFRQDTRDAASAAFWWIVGIVLVIIAVVSLTLTYYGLAPWATNRDREINHNSQQYQDATVRQLRDLVVGINTSADAGQKKVLTDQFCAVYNELKDAPADLASQHSSLC